MALQLKQIEEATRDPHGKVTVTCPFCKEKRLLNNPLIPSQIWHHECRIFGGEKVWFIHPPKAGKGVPVYALAGVGPYNENEAREFLNGPKL